MKKLLFFLLLALSVSGVQAQDFWHRVAWDADFTTQFDNRESQSDIYNSETFFSYKFQPQVGLYLDSEHAVFAGGNLIRDMGARGKNQPDPEFFMYYYHNGERLNAFAGAFPRMYMTGLPAEFFDWRWNFYDPVMEGVLLRYEYDRLYVELSGDWCGKKSATQREQFMLYSTGWFTWVPTVVANKFRPDDGRRPGNYVFSVGYHAMVQHFAASDAEPGVVDNILFKPWIRVNRRFGSVGAAWVQSFQRDRLHGDGWDLPNGFWVDLELHWRSLGMTNAIYLGDDLMPYWDRYGSELYKGDPFFRTTHGVYNRLEFYYEPRLARNVSLRIGSIHHYDGASWSWQQLATLNVRLHGPSR